MEGWEMKDDLPYFSHDNDARNHPKMEALRARFGWQGYGQFWALNEMIAAAPGARLDLSRRLNREAAAGKLGMTSESFYTFLDFLKDPEYDLVNLSEAGILTTDRTQEDFKRLEAGRARRAEYKAKRRRDGDNAERDVAGTETTPKGTRENIQNRIDENRIEENRRESQEARANFQTPEQEPEIIPPTVDEVATYCAERGNQVDPVRFVDYHAARGWKLGGSPVADWRAVVRTWEGREKPPEGALAGRPEAWGQEEIDEHRRELEERDPDEDVDLASIAGDTPLGKALRREEAEAGAW
jgi:hypothetical protein